MNATSLDMRNTDARRRIREAAAELATALDLPPLTCVSAIELRQPAVAQMRELEHVASFLEAIVGELQHGSQTRSG